MSELDLSNPRLASQEEWACAYFDLSGATGHLLDTLNNLAFEQLDGKSRACLRATLRDWIAKYGHLLGA